MRAWVALAALLVLAPAATAQEVPVSSPVALFFHVIDVQDMPVNTQEPDPAYTDQSLWGPMSFTLTCLDDVAAVPLVGNGLTSQAFNTARAYSIPSLVEYDRPGPDGTPRTHPARGLFGDIRIDPAVPVVLTWYLAVDDGGDEAAVPSAVANVRVRGTVRTSDAISIDDQAYDTGTLIAQGTSPAVTLVADQVVAGPDGSEGVRALGQMMGRWVYEVKVPLHVEQPLIPQQDGFNVRVDVFQDNPGCPDPDGAVLLSPLGAFSTAGARPRLDLAVQDLFIGHLAAGPNAQGGIGLDLHVATAFGAYDVRDVAASVVGPDGPLTATLASHVVDGYGPCGHDCGHTRTTHYAIEELAGALPPGAYNVTVTFSNLQGTASQTLSAEVVLAPPQEAPSVGLPMLVGLLGLAVLLRRA